MDNHKPLNQKKPGITFKVVIFILLVCFALIVLLVTFVLPSFKNIFEGQGTLSLPTQILLSVSEFLQTYFIVIVIVVLAMYWFYLQFKSNSDEKS